jgi:hypothetical protein
MSNTTLSDVSKAQLSANTTLSSNLGKANDIYNSINSQADEDIDALVSSAFDKLRSTGFDGVTGLEINKVAGMQTAIDNYVAGIQSALAPLNKADARAAFGNQMNKAIEEFVVAVKGSCEALITNMLAFKEDLGKIKAAMEAKAQNVNTAVNAKSSDLNSSRSGWTYSSGESN